MRSSGAHNDYVKDYVQNYINEFGVRKCEANALVVAPIEAVSFAATPSSNTFQSLRWSGTSAGSPSFANN